MKICPKCSKENLDSDIFCGSCGQILPGKKRCNFCGSIINESELFCSMCGRTEKGENSITYNKKKRNLQLTIYKMLKIFFVILCSLTLIGSISGIVYMTMRNSSEISYVSIGSFIDGEYWDQIIDTNKYGNKETLSLINAYNTLVSIPGLTAIFFCLITIIFSILGIVFNGKELYYKVEEKCFKYGLSAVALYFAYVFGVTQSIGGLYTNAIISENGQRATLTFGFFPIVILITSVGALITYIIVDIINMKRFGKIQTKVLYIIDSVKIVLAVVVCFLLVRSLIYTEGYGFASLISAYSEFKIDLGLATFIYLLSIGITMHFVINTVISGAYIGTEKPKILKTSQIVSYILIMILFATVLIICENSNEKISTYQIVIAILVAILFIFTFIGNKKEEYVVHKDIQILTSTSLYK